MDEAPTTQAEWDPVRLTYAVDGEEVELPFRLLVVGSFGLRVPIDGETAAIPVTSEGVDAVLAQQGPTLELTVEDYLLGSGRSREIVVPVGALCDFGPGRLTQRVPLLSGTVALLERLRDGQPLEAANDWEQELFQALGLMREPRAAERRDYAVAELTDRLARQIDAILHHPEFQRVESNWRGLQLLVSNAGGSRNVQVNMLDVDKHDLLEDFRAATTVEQSLFFDIVYSDELGQYGGEPYGAIIGAFEIGRSRDDRELIRGIAEVCSRAHAPFIAGGSPQLLGLERFSELTEATALSDLHGAPRWAKWWELAAEPIARYVSLTAPRVLLRSAYGPAREGRIPIEELQGSYREHIGRDHEHRLWGVAAFGLATCLIRSFEQYGACVDITGSQGGRIEGLPPIDERASTGRTTPVEVLLSEQKELELTELGFAAVSVARARGYIGFHAANSIHWAGIRSPSEMSQPADVGARLGAQLPYLFLVSRIAHYLKVIQRDTVGAMRTEAELQSELDGWLKRYVSDVDQPAPELRARRPLRSARLAVRDESGDGSSYRMHLEVVPHTKLMDTDMVLSVDGTLSRA